MIGGNLYELFSMKKGCFTRRPCKGQLRHLFGLLRIRFAAFWIPDYYADDAFIFVMENNNDMIDVR